jgi:hypothetical protein
MNTDFENVYQGSHNIESAWTKHKWMPRSGAENVSWEGSGNLAQIVTNLTLILTFST